MTVNFQSCMLEFFLKESKVEVLFNLNSANYSINCLVGNYLISLICYTTG
jgi:hypothetical protein